MSFLAQWTDREFSLMLLVTYLSLGFRIIAGLTGPILMLVAAKRLMAIPSRWPAYVIGGAAIYSLLMAVPYIMLHPIMQNIGLGIRVETYVKMSPILIPLNWLVGLASTIAVLTVCKRLARSYNDSNVT